MRSVASVLSVTSPYQTRAAYPVVIQHGSVQLTQSVRSIGSALQSGNLLAAQQAVANTPHPPPMGLLLSVSQPSGNNGLADSDYQAMRNALASGNLTAAQQAYTRLQSDLVNFHSTTSTIKGSGSGAATSPTTSPSTTAGAVSSSGGILNAVA